MSLLSRIVSLLFHPLLLPTVGLLLIFKVGGPITFLPLEIKRVLLLIVATSTFIIPLSVLPFLRLSGVIETLQMKNRRERFWPMLLTGLSFLAGYWLMNRIPLVPRFINSFMFFTVASVVVALCITFFWKISIHMTGIGGITAYIMLMAMRFNPDLAVLLVLSFLLSGIVGWARLRTESHSPAEVYAGFVLGFTIFSIPLFI